MSFTKKQSDPETLDFPFPSTPEQFKAYLKDRQSKLDAMMRKRELAKHSLMPTTKVQMRREYQNRYHFFLVKRLLSFLELLRI